METLATAVDSTLDSIVHAIADAFRPTRIILFGSRARGDAAEDSDYDIAVELEIDGDPRELRRAISGALCHIPKSGVDIVVRTPGQIESCMNDVGWIDYDIGREGIVVYAAGVGVVRQRMSPASRVREAPSEPPESVASWLERADEDLRNVEICLATDGMIPWSTICFHAQQAAEKYLKTLLIQRNIRPPRVHALTEVLAVVRAAGYALDGIDGDCEFLEPFAVDSRYPETMPIPEEASGRRAAGSVRRIVEAVRPLLVARRIVLM